MGLGVLLSNWSGRSNVTAEALESCVGKTIASMAKVNDTLRIVLEDGRTLDVTVSNHNEHNGYYGGFAVCASLTEADAIRGGGHEL